MSFDVRTSGGTPKRQRSGSRHPASFRVATHPATIEGHPLALPDRTRAALRPTIEVVPETTTEQTPDTLFTRAIEARSSLVKNSELDNRLLATIQESLGLEQDGSKTLTGFIPEIANALFEHSKTIKRMADYRRAYEECDADSWEEVSSFFADISGKLISILVDNPEPIDDQSGPLSDEYIAWEAQVRTAASELLYQLQEFLSLQETE